MKIRRLHLASECLYAYGQRWSRRTRSFPALFSVAAAAAAAAVFHHVSLVPLMLAARSQALLSLFLLLRRRRGGAVLLREQWRPIKETIMHCIGGPN